MAKVLETIFRIVGQLDGSVMSAISRAQGALAGLNRAMTNRSTAGAFGDLTKRLSELQKASAALERFKQLSRGGLLGGLDQLRTAQAEVQRLKMTLQAARDAGQKTLATDLARQLKTAERGLRTAQSNFGSQTSELRSLYGALEAAGIKVRNLAEAEQRLKAALSGANEALHRQEKFADAYRAHTEASNHVSTAWDNMQSSLQTAGALMEPFRAAADKAETFEHAMSRVKSLTQSENIKRGDFDRVREEMTELEEQARHLGATTQFTMLDAAQAQGFLGMAGWSKDQIIKAMPGMLDLAAASGMDLARTSDIVSDNLTALGMTADQVGHMTDVYAYALTRSNLNMEALGESMKYAAPAMHAYGGDIHDAAAAMMIMGNAGIKGSMAGTALRMGLLRLAGPPKKASKEMEALGVSLSDATRMAYESQAQLEALGIHVDAGMKPTEKMSFVLRELSAKMQGLSKDEKLAAVGAIFGVNAASGWLAVLEQGPEQFEKFRNALRESDGTAQQIAGTMNDDTRGSFLYLSSAIDALTTNVGSAFLPMMRSIYDGLNPIVTSIADWVGRNPGLIQGLGAIAAALSAAIVGLGAFRLALAGLSFATTTMELMRATAAFEGLLAATGGAATLFAKLGALGTIFKAQGLVTGLKALMYAAGPAGLAIAALAAGALLVMANWDKVGGYFEGLGARIGAALSGAGEILTPAFSELGTALGGLMESVSTSGLGEVLTGGVLIALEGVTGVLTTALVLAANFVATIAQVGGHLANAFRLLMGGEIIGAVKELGSAFKSLLGGTLKTLAAGLKGLYETLMRMVDIAGGIFNGSIFNGTFDWGAGARERQGERVRERVTSATSLKEEAREKLTMETRTVVREGGTDEGAIATALTERLRSEQTQSAAQQSEMLKIATAALDRSNALTEESRARILTQVESGLKEVQVTTASAVSAALKEEAAKVDVTDEKALMSFLQAARSTVRGNESLSVTEQRSVLQEISSVLSAATSGKEVTSELSAAVREMTATKAADRDALATAITSALKSDEKHDMTSKLEGALEYLKSRAEIDSTSRADMMAQIREGLQSEIGAKLSEQVTAAVKESADQSRLVESLTTVLTAQEDKSTAAAEMMLTTVESALEASNTRSSEEIASIMSELRSSMAAAVEEQRATTTGLFEGVKTQSDEFGARLSATSGATQLLTDGATAAGVASSGTAPQITGMGASAEMVAGALAAKAGEISSIQINVPQVNYMPVTVPLPTPGVVTTTHASGGIFPRGAHLTWFAEESAEAAIPLDNSKRSKGLWTQVGEMMGILPTVKETPQPESIMSGSRVKLPFGLKIPPRRRTTPGVPTEVREPKGKLPEALERYDEITHEMRTYSSAAPSTASVSEAMTAPITVNITFNGTVDREETKTGVMEGLEAMLERLNHERSRRSYA